MVYTHAFDLLAKVVAFALMLAGVFVVDPDAWVPPHSDLNKIAVFATIALSGALTWLLTWRPVLLPASTWAYVRWTFQVSPTWREAHELSHLFAIGPTDGLRWHPSLDVREVDREHRMEVLLARVQALKAARSIGWWERNRQQAALGRLLHPDTYLMMHVAIAVGLVPIGFGLFAGRGPLGSLAWIASMTVGPTMTALAALLLLMLCAWAAGMLFDRLLGRRPPPIADEVEPPEPAMPPPRNPFA